MPANIKCELIEGVVYMAPPLRYEHHGKPHSGIMGWLLVYAAATPSVECADNATVRLGLYNEAQKEGKAAIPTLVSRQPCKQGRGG
jgi:hypothetical protein